MNDKQKNIVTNILGLVFYALAIYSFFLDKDLKYIVGLLVIGSVLFLFKNSTLRSLLQGIVSRKNDVLRGTVDPDKEETPNEKG